MASSSYKGKSSMFLCAQSPASGDSARGNSTSNSYRLYDYDTSSGYKLLPYEKCYIDTVKKDSLLVSGYYYKVKDAVMDTFIRWLPYDFSNPSYRPTMNAGILIENNTYTSVKEYNEDLSFSLYPNPTRDVSYLSYLDAKPQYGGVMLFDCTGKFIANIYQGLLSSSILVNLTAYSSGIYYVVVKSADNQKIFKLFKY